MKRYLIYLHHALYLLAVAPVWIYGVALYIRDGPSMELANGNGGPLAYSPLLAYIITVAMVYFVVSILMIGISAYVLIRKRNKRLLPIVINICLAVGLVIFSGFMWIWLEEA